MLIIHDFGLIIEEYVLKGKENNFPMILQCPCCSVVGLLHRHGYCRNGMVEEGEEFAIMCYC